MLYKLFAAYFMASGKYMDKYRVDTWRHPNWDYSDAGIYFITICTRNRKKHFGEIIPVLTVKQDFSQTKV